MRDMPDTLQRAQRQLTAHHYRLTAQRRDVLALLAAHRNRHWSAEQICDALRDQGASDLSLATVYRTLALLEELRLVHRLDAGDGINRYSIGSAGPHAHWVCLGCKKVVDGAVPEVRMPQHPVGFEVVEQSLVYYGYCNTCQRERR